MKTPNTERSINSLVYELESWNLANAGAEYCVLINVPHPPPPTAATTDGHRSTQWSEIIK